MTVNKSSLHRAGVAVRCFHVCRGTKAGPERVRGQQGHFPPWAAGGWPQPLTSTRVGFSQWGMSRTVTFTGRMMDSLLWSRHEVAHSDPEGKPTVRWWLSPRPPMPGAAPPPEWTLLLPGAQ